MKTLVIALLALAGGLAGCSSANVSVRGSSFTTSAAPQPGSGVSGGRVVVNVQGSSGTGAFAGVTAIAALIGFWRGPPSQSAAPEMLEGRGINEVDCTQPIVDWSKNLKCK